MEESQVQPEKAELTDEQKTKRIAQLRVYFNKHAANILAEQKKLLDDVEKRINQSKASYV
ncbi:MAG: hypothetical protein WCJ29_00465 [bacterium]